MSFNQLSASTLQTIARRLLSLDVEAKNKLRDFEDKIIHLQVTNLDLDFYFSFIAGELFISDQLQNDTDETSASISGHLNAFIAAATADHSADAIFKGELHFSGEINTAKQFQQFAQSLNIDWQEPFAKAFGDPVGHSIATGLQNFSGWLFNSADSLRQDISEYLQEEARVTPTDCEQQHFFEQVDQLRSRADRINARITQVIEKRTSLQSTDPLSQ